MVEILIPILVLLVITIILLLSKLKTLNREKTIRELVAWSLVRRKPQEWISTTHEFPLSSYLINAQIKFCLRQEYRISGDTEMKFAKDIIEAYEDDLAQSYFRGNLQLIKSKYVIRGEDFFMFTLYNFMGEHQCDYEFSGHEMHKEQLEYKRYGDWGGPCYDATYALTDFAIVFHKMYYITYLYCKNSKITNPNSSPTWMDWIEKNLKDTLDSKQLELSRH